MWVVIEFAAEQKHEIEKQIYRSPAGERISACPLNPGPYRCSRSVLTENLAVLGSELPGMLDGFVFEVLKR